MSTCRLKALVSLYGLPNVVDGCGILSDGVSGHYRAKISNFTQH